jgi:hypothetical protein
MSLQDMLPTIAKQPTIVGSVEYFIQAMVEKLRKIDSHDMLTEFTDELSTLGGHVSKAVVDNTEHKDIYAPSVASPTVEDKPEVPPEKEAAPAWPTPEPEAAPEVAS